MKINYKIMALAISIALATLSCTTKNVLQPEQTMVELINLNNNTSSPFKLQIDFEKGKSHNHPLMAIWAEDVNGKYLETFYVSQSIGKGVFEKASGGGGKWMPGPVRRPAALPYWAHKRGVKEADGLFIPTPETPIPDAIAGATPKQNFRLIATPTLEMFPRTFHLLIEINQSWDWNTYWTNDKYTLEPEYKTSSQPSIIYSAFINLDSQTEKIYLNPIGHGHFSGRTGELFTDLSTITSALEIAKKISVSVQK